MCLMHALVASEPVPSAPQRSVKRAGPRSRSHQEALQSTLAITRACMRRPDLATAGARARRTGAARAGASLLHACTHQHISSRQEAFEPSAERRGRQTRASPKRSCFVAQSHHIT